MIIIEGPWKLRWGIAGLGKIANRFAKDLVGHVDNGVLVAAASRDKQKAEVFSNQHGCEFSYGCYQSLAESIEVDAVYVATIHPFHLPLVGLFLQHGKHVLVEKPAFTKVSDWDSMKRLAEEKGLLLMEAMKTVAFPAYRELLEFLKQNNIQLSHLNASFGSCQEFDPEHHLFNPALCGGATFDVGVYPLWLYADLCRHLSQPTGLLRSETTTLLAGSKVDETAQYTFDSPINAYLKASIVKDFSREAIIEGPETTICIRDKWWNPRDIDITHQGRVYKISHPVIGGGFQYEATHFGALVQKQQLTSPWAPPHITRQVLQWAESVERCSCIMQETYIKNDNSRKN